MADRKLPIPAFRLDDQSAGRGTLSGEFRCVTGRYRVNKEATDILSGFDRAFDKIEALPVNAEEKKRLIKEWLRSRLAETFEVHDRGR